MERRVGRTPSHPDRPDRDQHGANARRAAQRPDGCREPTREVGAELGAVEPNRELRRAEIRDGIPVGSLVTTWSLDIS